MGLRSTRPAPRHARRPPTPPPAGGTTLRPVATVVGVLALGAAAVVAVVGTTATSRSTTGRPPASATGATTTAAPAPTAPARPTTVSAASTTAPPTTVAPSTTTTVPPAVPEPGGGTTLFPGHRIVALAGTPGVWGNGVVGTAGPEALTPRLRAAAADYQRPDAVAVPAFDIVTVVAQHDPVDGTYTMTMPAPVVARYLAAAHAAGGMLLLEVQPGGASMLAEVQALAPYLADPAVGVAVDPQWEAPPGRVPAGDGRSSAAEIASVASWLGQFTVSHGLPEKLLEVREASPADVTGGPLAPAPPGVALAVGADGAGDAPTEAAAYAAAAAANPGLPLGYEVSTTAHPYPRIGQLMTSTPLPSIVEYR